MQIKYILKSDLYRYGGQTSILKGLMQPGFRYTYFFRLGSKYSEKFLIGLIFRFMIRRLGYKYGFQIPLKTRIGKGFYLGHFGIIVINKDAVIGKNCNIAHSVTIGQANRGKLKGCPVIGNEVWIGTGVVIVGGIKIGSNVLIAPNSFVNVNVPDNSLVMGNPVKIVQKDNPTEGYINYIKSINS